MNMKEIVRALMRPPALALRRAGVTPPERIFRHLHKTGPFAISLPEGRGTLNLMSWGNKVENELFWLGWVGHEPEVMRWWARFALDAHTVLDIGVFRLHRKGIVAPGHGPRLRTARPGRGQDSL